VIAMGVVLLAMGVFSLFVSYQALRYRRLFWIWPSIIGFKTRKEPNDSKLLSIYYGLGSLLGGSMMLFLAIKCLIG